MKFWEVFGEILEENWWHIGENSVKFWEYVGEISWNFEKNLGK